MVNVQLSRIHKGVLLLVCGILLFLYSTGLITRGIDIVMIVGSLIMVFYGLVLVDGYRAIRNLFSGSKNKTETKPQEPKKTERAERTEKNNNQK